MRKKRGRVEIPKTLDRVAQDEAGDIPGKEGNSFFACYLLTSLSPRHKGHTYIGFTVNPRRRIRQHNGEITSGAWRTKSKRPWEMVLCIYGFPCNISALQFEWAWQHPRESLAVREAALAFKSFSGVASKIKLAYTMLNLPAWQSLNITVNYFSTKYTQHGAFCPSLPEHMRVQVCSMDELPCFTKTDDSPSGHEHDLDAEEEDDDRIECNQSKHGNTTDASNSNSSRNDLHSTVDDEYCDEEYQRPEEPETVVDDSLAKVTCFCMEETAEKANLPVCTPKDTTEPETLAGKASGSDVSVENQNQARNSKATVRDGLRNRSSMSDEEVEVIDLLTPSPSCRMRSLSEKRRIAEIIDLTRSPNFIQL